MPRRLGHMESGLILTLSTVRARSVTCCLCRRGCRCPTQLLRTRISFVPGPRYHARVAERTRTPLRLKTHPRANPLTSRVRRGCGPVRCLGSKTAALTSPTPPARRRVFNIVAGPRALVRRAQRSRHALSEASQTNLPATIHITVHI
jgi:hypothetical protein